MYVKPKKHLGQHFLKDESIAREIADSLQPENSFRKVLEIGPGTGVLTKYLLEKKEFETTVIDIDTESIAYLEKHFPSLEKRIISGDFLRLPLGNLFSEPFAVIGNFPYNISSQILFKALEHRDQIPQLVGMFQKEVAERVAAPHGNKTYGIISVLVQAFYDVEYLFTVSETVFDPPPKVKSAVIRLNRRNVPLSCDEKMLFAVVKTGFNQRRKTLRNALKPLIAGKSAETIPFLDKRAEQLSVTQFEELTNIIHSLS
jgi:16S rRNA (adenine1518-N6/adenine1519-N6)-dimethyltransferase